MGHIPQAMSDPISTQLKMAGRTCHTRWMRSWSQRNPSTPLMSTSQRWNRTMPFPPSQMLFCSAFLLNLENAKDLKKDHLTCIFKIPQECRPFLIRDGGEGIIRVHPCEVDDEGCKGIFGGHDLVHLVWQVLPPSRSLKHDKKSHLTSSWVENVKMTKGGSDFSAYWSLSKNLSFSVPSMTTHVWIKRDNGG